MSSQDLATGPLCVCACVYACMPVHICRCEGAGIGRSEGKGGIQSG